LPRSRCIAFALAARQRIDDGHRSWVLRPATENEAVDVAVVGPAPAVFPEQQVV
jgi:hypothetical protein